MPVASDPDHRSRPRASDQGASPALASTSRPDRNESPSLLDAFRAKRKRLAIHSLELAALWIVGIHLVLMPWALGTMRAWAQIPSLILSVLGLAIALVPRNYTEVHTGSNRFRLLMWPKLVRFPIFWLGSGVLILVAIQALNPAWTYQTNGKGWWMDARPHLAWLPPGVTAPFERWNQWRMLMIYAAPWLTVCTIWVAFTRRRTVQIFLLTLVFNGLLIGLLGVAQRMVGNGKIYWFFVSPNQGFFSSFIYKNHAGAYLFLTLTGACGLGAWYYLRGLRRMEKSNPSGVLTFLATCIAVSIVTSYARGATLIMLAFLAVCTVAFIIHQFAAPSANRKPLIALVLLVVFGLFLKTGFDALKAKEAWDRMKSGITRQDSSLEAREQVTRAALEMLRDHWLQGVGAGSFRYLFPVYQHRHAELILDENKRPMFWEDAHNDIVQFPIELGATGFALVALGFCYWGLALIRSYFWANPLSVSLVIGLLLMVAYGWWDFPFQCPAILCLWCALWPVATMWAQFEEKGGSA